MLVVDPPRSGLDDNMLDCILRGKIKQILYISCNPATLGKNLSVLRQRYDVKVVQPVDLFPNSQHIEEASSFCKENHQKEVNINSKAKRS